MAKATRSLSGASQKKYFRNLIGSIEGIPADAAEALTGACEREITQVRVRLPVPDREKKAKPQTRPAGKEAGQEESAAAAPPSSESEAEFDPFAFSVVVVVTKEGRDGLAKRLSGITSGADLRALAQAQHVAIPAGELTDGELRDAIIEGALQRIANRKAAAS